LKVRELQQLLDTHNPDTEVVMIYNHTLDLWGVKLVPGVDDEGVRVLEVQLDRPLLTSDDPRITRISKKSQDQIDAETFYSQEVHSA